MVKKKHGAAIADLVDENETIEVDGVGGRKPRALLRRDLCEVIEPRAEETMALIWNEIKKSGLVNQIGSGLVLSGGACQFEGFLEMAEFISDIPVRRGVPERIGGLTDVVRSPEFATGVGLLIYGLENHVGTRATEAHEPVVGNRSSRRHVGLGSKGEGLLSERR